MATKKLMLNKARRLNDGTYPLVMQLLHLRKKRLIYSGLYLHPQEFDPYTYEVLPCGQHDRSLKDLYEKNKIIDEFIQRIDRVINMLEFDRKPYSCNDVVELYRIEECGISLSGYWQTKILQHRSLGKFGIADAQQSTLNSIIHFAGSSHITIARITPSFVRRYECSLLARGVSANTVCYYMRNFKTVMNCIIREGLANESIDVLFDGIKISPRKTVKRAITRHELRLMAQMTFEGEPMLELARDLFMFSFYTRGMPFVDIAFLQTQNLRGDVICYSRRKTGQHLQISVNPFISALIIKYATGSKYLFPIISSQEPIGAYMQYRSALRRINKMLKEIAQRLNLNVELTTYVARHSWATQAKEKGFPVSLISEGLGHSSENITLIYLKDFDHTVLDQANDVIANL